MTPAAPEALAQYMAAFLEACDGRASGVFINLRNKNQISFHVRQWTNKSIVHEIAHVIPRKEIAQMKSPLFAARAHANHALARLDREVVA